MCCHPRLCVHMLCLSLLCFVIAFLSYTITLTHLPSTSTNTFSAIRFHSCSGPVRLNLKAYVTSVISVATSTVWYCHLLSPFIVSRSSRAVYTLCLGCGLRTAGLPNARGPFGLCRRRGRWRRSRSAGRGMLTDLLGSSARGGAAAAAGARNC